MKHVASFTSHPFLFQEEDPTLHLIKYGKTYGSMDTSKYNVQLEGHILGTTKDFVDAVAMAIAAINVYNLQFPKKLEKYFEFIQGSMLGLVIHKPLQSVQKLAVKLTK